MNDFKSIKSATICWSHLCKLIEDNTKSINELTVTYPVCKGFLCELSLKSIISYEGQPIPHIHDLEKLFKSLKGKTQNYIKTETIKKLAFLNYTDIMFDNELKLNKDVFENWRYYFECNQRANMDFINAFYDICATYINQLKIN